MLERERLGMRLTEAGASVFPRLREAFLQIDQAMHDLESTKARRSLTVSTVATFAASWLVPRLGRFKQLHPDIEIRVEATSELVDLRRDRVDVALRHGLGDYPGLEVLPLMAPVLTPVASPGFLKAHRAVIDRRDACGVSPWGQLAVIKETFERIFLHSLRLSELLGGDGMRCARGVT